MVGFLFVEWVGGGAGCFWGFRQPETAKPAYFHPYANRNGRVIIVDFVGWALVAHADAGSLKTKNAWAASAHPTLLNIFFEFGIR